jgi:hypothetical protein
MNEWKNYKRCTYVTKKRKNSQSKIKQNVAILQKHCHQSSVLDVRFVTVRLAMPGALTWRNRAL